MAERAETRARTVAAARPAQPAAEPGESWLRQREQLLVGAASVVSFMVVWQAVAAARFVPALFLPGPTDVITAFDELVKDGRIGHDIVVSGQELAVGYLLAVAVAIPLGLLMGWYKWLRYWLDPFVTFFYSTPRIVLLPLLIIWFGIGINSKIAIVFLGAFFAILINTMAGVRNLDTNLLKVARSFSANDFAIFRTIALPGSVPFILTGLRLGTGHALIGVVVGELVAAQAGVGQMMAIAGATFQTAKVFAGLIIIASGGILLTYVIQRLERHFEAWRPQR